MSNAQPFHSIVITGASSGLGRALALHYAGAGKRLFLTGRHAARLAATATACREMGAEVHEKSMDITDAATVAAWLQKADSIAPVDCIIANAGISAGSGEDGETFVQAQQIFLSNINGVLHTVMPLLPAMAARNGGQLVIIGSLAGVRGLPSCPAYSASKAAVMTYGDALRGWLRAYGVGVSVVCPGYIRTPMTAANPFPMPLLMDAEKAAMIIAKGIAERKGRIAFPRRLYWPLKFLAFLPAAWTDALFSRLPAKPAL